MDAVDLFCGAGGSSTGAAWAGLRIVAAVNHWPRAVETHQANHPGAKHYCQDVALLDPTTLPPHDVLLASPACQGHSRARGKEQPHHDAQRATAMCVVEVVEQTRPRFVVVENVPDFRRWVLFPQWHSSLERLGYSLALHVLDAADFGVAQNRERLVIIGTRGRSHAPISRSPIRRTARQVVDFSTGKWSPIEGHCESTLRRVREGRREFGRQFLVSYYGSTKGGRSLDRPVGTITTRDRWAVVDGDRMRMLSPCEVKAAMGFPDHYVVSGTKKEQIHQLGNAVVPSVMQAACASIMEAI